MFRLTSAENSALKVGSKLARHQLCDLNVSIQVVLLTSKGKVVLKPFLALYGRNGLALICVCPL